MKRMRFTKEGDALVGKVLDDENAYWIFSDISTDRFHWENVLIDGEGNKTLICEINGKRMES